MAKQTVYMYTMDSVPNERNQLLMQAETWMNLQSEKVNLEGWIPGNYINKCLLQENFRNGG